MPHHVPHPSEKFFFVLHLEAHGKDDEQLGNAAYFILKAPDGKPRLPNRHLWFICFHF